jgi:hypothetical protein
VYDPEFNSLVLYLTDIWPWAGYETELQCALEKDSKNRGVPVRNSALSDCLNSNSNSGT